MHWVYAKVAAAKLRIACDGKMSLQGKHSRASSESPPEKEAKQHRLYESPCESPHCTAAASAQPKPTVREVEAAKAARDRLYGSSSQPEVTTSRLPSGVEPSAVNDPEYTPRNELQPLGDVSNELVLAIDNCESTEWSVVCSGLLLFRRLVVHHKEVGWEHMPAMVPLVLRSVKSLRSSVSKTAVMTAADLIETYGDDILPHLDNGGTHRPAASLLCQLLLKGSSNDKRFVIEEVQRTLGVAAGRISPLPFLELLLPYASHKSPKLRGTVASVIAASAERMQEADWNGLGLDKLLVLAGRMISDNTPEARSSAKKLAATVHAAYKKQLPEWQLAPELQTKRMKTGGITINGKKKASADCAGLSDRQRRRKMLRELSHQSIRQETAKQGRMARQLDISLRQPGTTSARPAWEPLRHMRSSK